MIKNERTPTIKLRNQEDPMRHIALIVTILFASLFTPAFAQEPASQEQTGEMTRLVAIQLAKREGISTQAAEAYLAAGFQYLHAIEASKTDKTGAAKFLADYWDKQSLVVLLSGKVVAQGEEMVKKIQANAVGQKPGTRLPEPIEKEARQWMAQVILLGNLAAEAQRAAATFAEQSALRAPECQPGSMTLKCGDVLEHGLKIVQSAKHNSNLVVLSAKILTIAVAKYLTY